MSLGCMGTVSVLLWVSKRMDWSCLEGRWWGTAGRGCTSQGFNSLELGRLLLPTWLLIVYLIAYLAPILSHFLRKKSCISCTFGDHSDVLSARDFQEKPKENLIYQRMMKNKFCSVMELFSHFSFFLLIQLSFSQHVWKFLASHLHQEAPQCHQKTILECWKRAEQPQKGVAQQQTNRAAWRARGMGARWRDLGQNPQPVPD